MNWIIGLALVVSLVTSARANEKFSDDILNIRDPFKKPTIVQPQEGDASDLQRFPAETFKLIGVMTGPKRMRALLSGTNGRTYFVFEGMEIGLRKGIIRSITPDKMLVRERFLNILGQEEIVDIELKLPPEGPSQSVGRTNLRRARNN